MIALRVKRCVCVSKIQPISRTYPYSHPPYGSLNLPAARQFACEVPFELLGEKRQYGKRFVAGWSACDGLDRLLWVWHLVAAPCFGFPWKQILEISSIFGKSLSHSTMFVCFWLNSYWITFNRKTLLIAFHNLQMITLMTLRQLIGLAAAFETLPKNPCLGRFFIFFY